MNDSLGDYKQWCIFVCMFLLALISRKGFIFDDCCVQFDLCVLEHRQ